MAILEPAQVLRSARAKLATIKEVARAIRQAGVVGAEGLAAAAYYLIADSSYVGDATAIGTARTAAGAGESPSRPAVGASLYPPRSLRGGA
jgi:hypothetical protein